MAVPEGYEVVPAGYEVVKPKEEPNEASRILGQGVKDAIGGNDAVLSMAAGIPSYIASGLWGLGTLASTGDIGKAGAAVDRVQASNFGLGAPKPLTQSGQEATDSLGAGQGYLTEKAGDLGEKVGDSLGRTHAEIAINTLLNFAPIPGAKFVKALSKGVEREFGNKAPVSSSKLDKMKEAVAADKAVPEGYEKVKPAQADMFNDYGFNEQQAAESKGLDTHPGQPDLFGPLNVPKADMPTTPWERRPEPTQQSELPLQNSPQQVAEMQNRGSGQTDMFSLGQENAGQPVQVPGPSIQLQVQLRRLFDEHAARLAQEEAAAQKAGDAQAAIDARQRAIELEVKRQQTLDSGAAERARQEAAPVAGLDEARAREQQASVDRTKPYMDEGKQGLIDDSDHGYQANQYGGGQGGLRIDENGMPIRADRSMEAQHLQDPLQRNLWGDEMSRQSAQEAPRGITAAMDRMDPAARSEAIRSQFPNSQRGAINMDALTPGYEKKRMINDGIELTFLGGFDPKVQAHDRFGKQIAELKLNTDTFEPNPSSNMEAGHVHVDPAFRRKGVAEQMYKFVSELGNDVQASSTLLPDGRKMWEGFEKKGVANNEWQIPRSQRGAVDLSAFQATDKSAASLTKDSPEVIAAAAALSQRKKAGMVTSIIDGNPYVDNITSPAEVLAAEGKDIGAAAAIRMKNVGSGVNSAVLSSNNPLLKFLRYGFRQAVKGADQMAERFITGKDGIDNKWRGLSQAEKNEVAQVWMEQDKSQQWFSEDKLRGAGYTDKQIDIVNHQREMEQLKLQVWNKALEATGQKPVEERPGHFPGVFSGDYRTLILDKDGSPVGYLGTNTRWGHNKALDDLKAKYPEHQFVDMGRKKLASMPNDHYTTGMTELVKVLAEHDPEFAELQKQVDTLVSGNADRLYGANVHSLDKKGIWGTEGNKPWQDQTTNTNEAYQAYVKYWSDGMKSHLQLPFETQMKGLLRNPELNMPNAASYVEKYMLHATGRSVGQLGDALNKILDLPFKNFDGVPYLQNMSVGPSVARAVVNRTTQRVGQKLMGYGNVAHTLVQMLQVPAMSYPQFVNIAHQFNLPAESIVTSQGAGMRIMGTFLAEGKGRTPYEQAALDHAKAMGLGHFSEFQDISSVGQGKVGKTFDKVVDFNRQLPEITTRPFTFFTLADMLKDEPHMTDKQKLDAAYNATQEAMVDYSPAEKPMIYSSLGQTGKLTGSLSTFKHAAFSQTGRFFKEAAKGNVMPLATASAMMFAMAGIKGIWGYDDADTVVKAVTGAAGNRRSIRELALDPKIASELIKSGALSTYTDLDLAGRVAINGMIPQSIPEAAVGPFGGEVGKMVGAGIALAKDPRDPIAQKNAVIAALPNGPVKGLMREAIMATGKNNSLQDKNGEQGNPRTPHDQLANQFGVTSLAEANRTTSQYNDLRRQLDKRDKQKAVLEDVRHYFNQGALTPEKQQELVGKYIEAEGDPKKLVATMKAEGINMNLTKQQRLEGVKPKSLDDIHRYLNYERSRTYANKP